MSCAAADQSCSSRLTSSHSASRTAKPARSEVDAAGRCSRFDRGEPRAELGGGAAQGQLGVGAGVAGGVDDGEQEVAELPGDGVVVTGGERRTHLVELLADLVQRAIDIVPVEADLGRLALQLLGVGQRRLRRGDTVEQRLALLLVALDVVPVGLHRLGIVRLDVAEHVGVAAHELVVDAVDDVDDREAAVLLGDGGMELDVVEEVAELLDDVRVGRRVVGSRASRASTSSKASSTRYGASDLCVCSRSHGQRSRNVRASSWKRT